MRGGGLALEAVGTLARALGEVRQKVVDIRIAGLIKYRIMACESLPLGPVASGGVFGDA